MTLNYDFVQAFSPLLSRALKLMSNLRAPGRFGNWVELLGCGMVHPEVLRAGGIDPEVHFWVSPSVLAWNAQLCSATASKTSASLTAPIFAASANFRLSLRPSALCAFTPTGRSSHSLLAGRR